jgi:hypothetical protein
MQLKSVCSAEFDMKIDVSFLVAAHAPPSLEMGALASDTHSYCVCVCVCQSPFGCACCSHSW